MDNQQTPETDGAEIIFSPLEGDAWVPASISRKLERERDEAIRKQDETNRSSKYACDYHYEEKLKAERERDEAREELAIARETLRLIAEEGGQTIGRTIIPDGAWCAEQARRAIFQQSTQ
jgi:hypothetical protein